MPYINDRYFTDQEIREIKAKLNEDEFEKFMVSGVVGAITGSTIIGGLIGGSFIGGLIGDIIEGDDDSLL